MGGGGGEGGGGLQQLPPYNVVFNQKLFVTGWTNIVKGERGVEFVSVKKNSSLQHKLCITCEVSRGFAPDCGNKNK